MSDLSVNDNNLDPYERWMADHGIAYDLPALHLQDDSYVSGVIEFDEPQELEEVQRIGMAALGFEDTVRSIKVWTGVSGQPFESRFLPAILPPAVEDRELGQITAAELDRQKDLFSNTFTKELFNFRNPELLHFQENTPSADTQSYDALLSAQSSATPAPLPFPVFKLSLGFPVHPHSIAQVTNGHIEQIPNKSAGLDANKPLVIVAIIDDGVPFAHKNFRSQPSGKTRIDYCWNQSADSRGDVAFGAEFTGEKIDEWIASGMSEDAIYRKTGVLGGGKRPSSPLAGMYSHGAHVLDTMTGAENIPAEDQNNIRIIAVDLPVSSSWDTSGFGKDMFILSALHYIFDRADKIARSFHGDANTEMPGAPVLINLSYGFSGGPHDGTGRLERAMSEIIKYRHDHVANTQLVMPSGNMCHDKVNAVIRKSHLEDQKVAKLPWRISPNDRTSSFLEIWLPLGTSPSEFNFSIVSPSGKKLIHLNAPLKSEETSEEELFQYLQTDDGIVGQFSIDRPGVSIEGKFRIMLILAPTESSAVETIANSDPEVADTIQKKPTAEAGVWGVEIQATSDVRNTDIQSHAISNANELIAGDIECWIQRDVSFGAGNTGAKQSFFDDPLNQLYGQDGSLDNSGEPTSKAALVRRFGTLNGMSTFQNVTVVGGVVGDTSKPAYYSSAGALRKLKGRGTTMRVGKKVDLSAITDQSQFQKGVVGAGTRSCSSVIMNGTSVAAPQVVRDASLELINRGETETRSMTILDLLADETNPSIAYSEPHPELKKARLGRAILKNRKRKRAI